MWLRMSSYGDARRCGLRYVPSYSQESLRIDDKKKNKHGQVRLFVDQDFQVVLLFCLCLEIALDINDIEDKI